MITIVKTILCEILAKTSLRWDEKRGPIYLPSRSATIYNLKVEGITIARNEKNYFKVFFVISTSRKSCSAKEGLNVILKPNGKNSLNALFKILINLFQWAIPSLFLFIFVFSNKHLIYTTNMSENVHLVYDAGIWTHDLQDTSLLPYTRPGLPPFNFFVNGRLRYDFCFSQRLSLWYPWKTSRLTWRFGNKKWHYSRWVRPKPPKGQYFSTAKSLQIDSLQN